jgi:hypothetical protein
MAISSDALYSDLLQDLSPWLKGDEIHQLLCKEKLLIDPWLDSQTAAARSLANSFYNKFVDMCEPDAEQRAFAKFTSANERCKQYRLSDNAKNSWDDEFVGRFKQALFRILYPRWDSTFELYEILSEARDGPGSSIQVVGCDSYSKLFASRGSSTSVALVKYFKYFFSHDHRWRSALEFRQEHFGDVETVVSSKLSFVPKNRDTMRSICVEPSVNMFFQLGLGSLLEGRLKSHSGIDLATQPGKNRRLACIGSIDGSYATIDLASASDTISLNLLKEVLPAQFYELLLKLRCGSTTYQKQSFDLHMVSTMGNGFTFPLQTIIFSACVEAVYGCFDIPIEHPFGDSLGNYGVFGDDIICRTEMYRHVCRCLGLLGFTVNAAKSFSEGPFRESCGEDYFNGVNIRGVYAKSLRTVQDFTVLVNRLNDFTARTDISVPLTVKHLMSKIGFQPVPLYENDDAGIRVPLSFVSLKKRHPGTQAIRYYRWSPEPSRLKIDVVSGVIRVPRGEKKRIFNSEGLWLSFLLGGLRSYEIPIRIDRVRYRRRRNFSPNWDCLFTGLGKKCPNLDLYGRRLIGAVEANLYWLANPAV